MAATRFICGLSQVWIAFEKSLFREATVSVPIGTTTLFDPDFSFKLNSVDPYEDYGYKLSDDLLDFTDKPTKPGKDMDNLDGPA